MITQKNIKLRMNITGICFLVSLTFCIGSVWTNELPKTYPDRTIESIKQLEEVIRANDQNSIEVVIAKKKLAQFNKYLAVAGQKKGGRDVDLDGDVDMDDVNLVKSSVGVNGRELIIEKVVLPAGSGVQKLVYSFPADCNNDPCCVAGRNELLKGK